LREKEISLKVFLSCEEFPSRQNPVKIINIAYGRRLFPALTFRVYFLAFRGKLDAVNASSFNIIFSSTFPQMQWRHPRYVTQILEVEGEQ